MAYETKTLAELEEIAANLRQQVLLHPEYELEKVELKECEQWVEMRRHEVERQSRGSSAAA